MAERHVREGEVYIALQKEVVAGLPAGIPGALEAEKLLADIEELQGMHVAYLYCLRRSGSGLQIGDITTLASANPDGSKQCLPEPADA